MLLIFQIWLNVLLDTMKDTVRNIIASIAQSMAGDPEFEFLTGFWNYPGQVSFSGRKGIIRNLDELSLQIICGLPL